MKKLFTPVIIITALLLITYCLLPIVAFSQHNRSNTKKSVPYRANYQRVDLGSAHTLEIRNGTLWAWGGNGQGRLGDGTTINRHSPVQIGTDSNWVSISAGNHSLGLKSDGTLWAWGGNSDGRLGDGTTIDRHSPVQIGTDKWISVSATYNHSLGLKSDGTLWAWGDNDSGQLGDGTIINRTSPVQIGTGNDWVSIIAAYSHSLALKSNGTLWAWGGNWNGQVGDGTTATKYSPVQIGADTTWVTLASSYIHSLGLKSDGTLWAWGKNLYGEIGDGSNGSSAYKTSPVKIGTDNKWIGISAGADHSNGLKSDGTIWSWGKNTDGELGDGTNTDRNAPVQTGVDNSWTGIVAGGSHSMGLKSDGALWAWGFNGYGQLGDGTSGIGTNKISPVQTSVILNIWLSIAGGRSHTLGLKSDGTLWAWGSNGYGQIGDGTQTSCNKPVQIGTDNKWVGIAAGGNHSLGLKADGTLWAWGHGFAGQLGIGTGGVGVKSTIPVKIGIDNKWISITAGNEHSLGLKADGTLWAWGFNNYGELGDGTTTQRNSPVKIGTDNKWISISGGKFYSLGLKSDGTLWAWGDNNYGQLGDGTYVDRRSPTKIGIDKWVTIAPGGAHSFGLRADGTLWAWGANSYGHLGDGTTTDRTSPVQIGTDKWISITAGGIHSLGLKSDGSFWAWGDNNYGQLGDGTNTGRIIPTQIGTENKWTFVAAGYDHSLGLKSDRNRFCATGQNGGQLGDGTTTSKNNFVCNTNLCVPPAAPLASNKIICATSTATLSASGSGTLYWYGAATGGSSLGTGPNYITPSLTSSTTYYVQDNTCMASATRTTVTVTVNPLPSVTANSSATNVCAGTIVILSGGGATSYTWTGGATNGVGFIPSITKTYTVTGTDVNNCSNKAKITVTVNPLPAVTTNLNGNVIIANQSGAIYQWLNCNTGNSAISGATSKSYTATVNGNYAVEVTQGGCSDTSACVNVNSLGISPLSLGEGQGVRCYPNPTSGNFTIEIQKTSTVILCNILGDVVFSEADLMGKNNIDISHLQNGIYVLTLTDNNSNQFTAKIIKQ